MKKLLVVLVAVMSFGFIGCSPWYGCRMDIGVEGITQMLTPGGLSEVPE